MGPSAGSGCLEVSSKLWDRPLSKLESAGITVLHVQELGDEASRCPRPQLPPLSEGRRRGMDRVILGVLGGPGQEEGPPGHDLAAPPCPSQVAGVPVTHTNSAERQEEGRVQEHLCVWGSPRGGGSMGSQPLRH